MGKIDDILAGKQDQQISEVTGEDALKHLVGDGAKYATVEEMAKGMLNGQLHISQIEKENAGFRDTSTQAKGIDDILAALKGQQQPPTDGNQLPADQQKPAGSDEPTVAEQITAALATRDANTVTQAEDANVVKVIDDLAKIYGDKALDVYQAVGKEMGLDLESLAKKSPAAVMKLVADARPAANNNSGLPQSSHNTDLTQVQGGVMNQTAINKQFAEGKLSRYEKIALENEMLTKLGGTEYFK
jgi:hypothetical protein